MHQKGHKELGLNGTKQLLFYTDDVNLLGKKLVYVTEQSPSLKAIWILQICINTTAYVCLNIS
jgi:hypothetical protein